MCTWVVIAVIVLLVLVIGARRAGRVPGRIGIETITGTLGKRYLGDSWSDTFVPAGGEQIRSADHLMAYTDRLLERQIAKAQGLLPFNAILLGVLGLERGAMADRLGWPAGATDFISSHLSFASKALPFLGTCEVQVHYLFITTMIGLALSSLLCLSLFSNRWHPVPDYASFHRDLAANLKRVRARAKTIEWATVIAQACLIVAVVLVATAEFGSKSGGAGPQIRADAGAAMQVAANIR